MKGNLSVCPNTNHTSAIKPIQMPATRPRSEILLRIVQGLIAQWTVLAVKIGFFLNLLGKGVLALNTGESRRALAGLNRVLKLTCLGIRRRQSSNEKRIILLCDSVQLQCQLDRPCPIS